MENICCAFADHGAAFYSGSGNDAARALDLASANVANRPTLRAFEQAYATAVGAGVPHAASGFLAAAQPPDALPHAIGTVPDCDTDGVAFGIDGWAFATMRPMPV